MSVTSPTMADLSTEQRCELAVKLVEQAPPGEVKFVMPPNAVKLY